ncbi:MAG: helix-turn-helix domain-containing protein [Acidobacteriota bacterium]
MAKDTRSTILTAAAAVLVKNPGATLAEIGSEAGVGRTTLHRYFPKRDDLLRALILASLRDIDDATADLADADQDAAARLLTVLEVLVPLGDRCHFLWLSPRAYEHEEAAAHYQRQLQQMEALADDLKREGWLGDDVPTRWFVAAMDSLIYTAWYDVENGYLAKREAPRLVHRTLLGQLGPKRADARTLATPSPGVPR